MKRIFYLLGISVLLQLSLNHGPDAMAQEKGKNKSIIVGPHRITTQLGKAELAYPYLARIFLDGNQLTECYSKDRADSVRVAQRFALACLKGKNVRINPSLHHEYQVSLVNGELRTNLFDEKFIDFVDDPPSEETPVTLIEELPVKGSGQGSGVDPGVLSLCKDLLTMEIPPETITSLQKIMAAVGKNK